jgi:hypothetical protein
MKKKLPRLNLGSFNTRSYPRTYKNQPVRL